jgi:type III restriction enzyme
MIDKLLSKLKNQWLHSGDCSVAGLLAYIRQQGKLRDAQVEAIETYLFLKIRGENKPLWQLFSEGFFSEPCDFAKLNVNQTARAYLQNHTNALALYQFTGQKINGKTLLPEIQKSITDNPEALDYDTIIKDLFYRVNYPDYLMSLPMGAGKTFLMAAFIYLDLYFAQNEPDNRAFAHNFLVLIPNGLKSSIVPSLKSIANFDPSWVLPEPAASQIKALLKFDVLDVPKSGKKSNTARNPNAQKVNACLATNPFGQVFLVNAEKVILESFNETATIEGVDKPDTTNELKSLFGKIPHLSLLIDEVHHAATDDIKLRQAVNYWHAQGNITTVLGFSGTPYLQKAEIVNAGDYSFKFNQITNTVYYYPLVTAIEKFLKKPTVKVAHQLERLEIIKQGIQDFDNQYANMHYANGSIPKIAIYCSSIAVLEEEVYPYLVGALQLKPANILKYHGGNSEHSLPKENELAFRTLDLPASPIRYILLVQVGKEGWDCPSLAGVILSQKGDSPSNMVLQTACRCLRQVDKGAHEKALIWLNADNAETLNKQLKQEQNTSIDELNRLNTGATLDLVERLPRIAKLNLPSVSFNQLRINYQTLSHDDNPQTADKLKNILNNTNNYRSTAYIGSSDLHHIDQNSIDLLKAIGTEVANYKNWLFEIYKDSLQSMSLLSLQSFEAALIKLFNLISYDNTTLNKRCWNDLFDRTALNNDIRLAFCIHRSLNSTTETVPKEAKLLLVDKLGAVALNDKLYPNAEDALKIIALDASNTLAKAINEAQERVQYDAAKAVLAAQGMAQWMPSFEVHLKENAHNLIVQNKDRSFHYLPYDFAQSGFERDILEAILRETTLQSFDLEIYFNGERGLTEFVIDCYKSKNTAKGYAKENTNNTQWQKIGKYTPDFLVIKRDADNTISKALIIETKGKGFAEDFKPKREFMENTFKQANPDFDFLYLEDTVDIATNLSHFKNRAQAFFK